VEAWGGAATTIGLADLADAFSKKTVQGTATGLNIIVPFKIYEVTKYLTLTSISEGFAALIMNGDTWESLNADEQALIAEAGKVFVQKAYDIAIANTDVYVGTIEDDGLNEVYELTAAEQQDFINVAYSLFPQMESEVGDKGQQLRDLLKQSNGID
jgi:TRAP-type C4-dicarboxylate transport system substrate-binding protein